MAYDSETEEFIQALQDEGGGGRWPFMIPTYDWYSEPVGAAFFVLILGVTLVMAMLVREDPSTIAIVITGGSALLIGSFSTMAWSQASKVLGRRLSNGIQYVWAFSRSGGSGWIGCLVAPFVLGGLGFALTSVLVSQHPALIGAWVVLTSLGFSAVTTSLRPPAILFLAASSHRALTLKRALISAAQPLRVISFVKLPNTNVEYLLSAVQLNVFRKEDDREWLRSVERAIDIVFLVVIDCHTMTDNLVQELIAVTRKNAIQKSIVLADRIGRERFVAVLPPSLRVTWQRQGVFGDFDSIRAEVRRRGKRRGAWAAFALLMTAALLLLLRDYYVRRGF